MKVGDRLLLFLYSLGFLALAVATIFVLISSNGPAEISYALTILFSDSGLRLAVIGVSAFVVILSLRFLVVGSRNSRPKQVDVGVEQQTEIGHIRISLATIESIAVRAARKVRGIRELEARVRHDLENSNVGIGLKVVVDGETPIQALSEELQKVVKEQVELIAGIQVYQVSVYVSQTVQPERTRLRVE